MNADPGSGTIGAAMVERDDDHAVRLGERIIQACEDLRTTQEALRLHSVILENMAEGVMLSRTSDHTIAYTNPAFARMFGYGSGEMAGMHVSLLNAPDETSPQAVANEIIAAVEAAGRWQGMVHNIRKDGSTFWCSATVSTFDHPLHGRVWVCVQGDITERKKAEEELRESERRLKEAQAVGQIGDWEFDIERQRIVWSDQTYRLYDRNRSLGPPTPEEEAAYYSPEQARTLREYARRAIEEGKSFDYDLEAELPGGRQVQFSARMRSIRDANGRVIKLFGTVEDITERRRAEEELQSQQVKLRALSARLETAVVRERQRIAADLHDHVGQVLGLARLEISTIAPPRSHPEQLATWRNAKRHIDQAIRFTRTLSAELHPPVLRQLGIGPALRWLARETSNKAGIPVSCRIVGPSVRLDGDTATYVYRAALELVRNARRHGRPKRISITFRRDARTVRLRVRDDGVGFDTSRVDRPAPAKSFGLFSLRERTAAMDGSFALDTAPGMGTSVEITMPVRSR